MPEAPAAATRCESAARQRQRYRPAQLEAAARSETLVALFSALGLGDVVDQPHRATRTPKAKRKTGAQKEGSDSLRARPGGLQHGLPTNGVEGPDPVNRQNGRLGVELDSCRYGMDQRVSPCPGSQSELVWVASFLKVAEQGCEPQAAGKNH